MKQKVQIIGENKLSFATILLDMVQEKLSGKKINVTEPLSFLEYNIESSLKNSALSKYWKMNNIPGEPRPLISSPKGRFYRTTTKRKVFLSGDKIFLSIGIKPAGDLFFSKSTLEPDEHSIIYNTLIHKINESPYKIVGKSLNYIIIRGTYSEFSVIFNVHTLNAGIVRKLKSLSELLKSINTNVVSAFIYLDPTRSDYYLESNRPIQMINFKKLFGPDKLFLRLGNKKYSYHPTSFSQINESMIPSFLAEAGRMLQPNEDYHFFDLYCGYGLFTLFFSDFGAACTGIDIEGESIISANTNASFYSPGGKIRFISRDISGESLMEILPSKIRNERFLLDPPRQGTGKGVIKIIAERKPIRVLHIFCGIEEIKRETAEWYRYGYNIKEIQPLDMFPGTPNMEVFVLLEPVK